MSTVKARKTRHLRPTRWLLPLVFLTALLIVAAFSIQPVRAYYFVWQGHRALSDAKYDEALADFRSAQAIEPKNSEIAFWMARACRKTGDLDGIRKYLGESQKLGYPDKKRLEREWLLVLAETGRIREVEDRLPDMLINPGDDGSEICDALSKGYLLSLRYPEAHKLLDTWAADFPLDYRPYLRRGQIHAGHSLWQSAIDALREAQKRAPRVTAIQRELGRCYFRNDEPEAAEVQLKEVVRRDPSDVSSLMILAQIAFDRNELKTTLENVEHVITLQPYDFPARMLLAKVTLAMGNPARSVEVAEALAEEWPEDLNIHYILAQSLRAVGRSEDAKRHFAIHSELDKLWHHIETTAHEINNRPSDSQLRYELGLLLLRHVSRSEGVAYLESVFQYTSNHPEAHQALADYYGKIGNHTLASQHQKLAGTNFSSASTSMPLLPKGQSE